MNIEFIKDSRVLIAQLNRPKVNALNSGLMYELVDSLVRFDADPDIGCIIIKSVSETFCGGADIKEMISKTYSDMVSEDYFGYWERLKLIKTPMIAAVNGYALGGGCELAMMCDVIYASENAVFGQPEIKLGVIPGIGGTQRLTKLVGKSKAMEIILTGRNVLADEAEKIGLVSKVFPENVFWDEVFENAKKIACFSKIACAAAKDCVNKAMDLPDKEGVKYERESFHQLFTTKDQREGMNAFLEKREPKFN